MTDDKSTANTTEPAADAPPETKDDAAKMSAQAKKLYEACATGVHIQKATIG